MKKVIWFILLSIIISSCDKRQKEKFAEDNINVYRVQINDKDQFFNWDEFVDKIELIPLETNKDGLIGRFTKGIVINDNVFIFDVYFQSLLHFDISGKFERQISRKGGGPGEYLEIRDFCIDDSILYTLDYGRIHSYKISTGKHVETWTYDMKNGFNPSSIALYNKDNYYLWNNSPDVWNPEKGTYYMLRNMRHKEVREEYVKFEYKTMAFPPRFYFCPDERSYYFNNGKDVICKITNDSLAGLFFLDFGNMSLSSNHIDEFKRTGDMNDFLSNNAFKLIENVFKVNELLYFACTGPGSYTYEGLINEKKQEVKIGRRDFRRSPRFFFSDKNVLYGYYEPSTLLENLKKEVDINSCFANLLEDVSNIELDDNPILVKVYMKELNEKDF